MNASPPDEKRPLRIPGCEFELQAVRATGPGGQNVNKVSSAIHLRYDIHASSLPEGVKERLLCIRDSRVTASGLIIIKARKFRTQERNRQDAIARLEDLVNSVAITPRKRKPTRPGRAARQRRLDDKKKRSDIKKQRSKHQL